MKSLFLVLLLFFNFFLIKSVIISSLDEDIREKIMETFKDAPLKQKFKLFHFLYQKSYDLNSEEGIKRYQLFKNALLYVEETNSKNLSYKVAINQFADLSDDEFKNQYLTEVDNPVIDPQEFFSFNKY